MFVLVHWSIAAGVMMRVMQGQMRGDDVFSSCVVLAMTNRVTFGRTTECFMTWRHTRGSSEQNEYVPTLDQPASLARGHRERRLGRHIERKLLKLSTAGPGVDDLPDRLG